MLVPLPPFTFISAVPNGITRSGETIKMLKDGITFSCDQDNYSTDHSYPRGDDPAHDTSLPIYIDGETLTAANASYNSLTGDISITIPGHGLSTTDQIRIENNSLTFTCSRDNNISVHNYTRP